MQYNPEVESIIDMARDLAIDMRHEYVTLEHVALALIRNQEFRNQTRDFGVDIESLDADIEAYLQSMKSLELESVDPEEFVPKKTNGLERMINRAVTQVVFSNRRFLIQVWTDQTRICRVLAGTSSQTARTQTGPKAGHRNTRRVLHQHDCTGRSRQV
jgi:ATP-dependent Clp protease ATP-binding subunit ClpA